MLFSNSCFPNLIRVHRLCAFDSQTQAERHPSGGLPHTLIVFWWWRWDLGHATHLSPCVTRDWDSARRGWHYNLRVESLWSVPHGAPPLSLGNSNMLESLGAGSTISFILEKRPNDWPCPWIWMERRTIKQNGEIGNLDSFSCFDLWKPTF